MVTTDEVEVIEWEVEYEVAIELDDGRVIKATGSTRAEALRALADYVEEDAYGEPDW